MFGLATTLCLKSDLFWLQYSVQFREKVRELCLASLGHADYLGFNLPSNSVKKNSRARALGLASLGHVVYFGFNLPSNSEKKFESSASLRSAMWFILVSISSQIQSKISRALPRFARPRGSFWHQYSVKFREKNFDRSASLRSAMWFILASISVKFTPKIRDVGLASLGHVVYFFFNPLKCLIND